MKIYLKSTKLNKHGQKLRLSGVAYVEYVNQED